MTRKLILLADGTGNGRLLQISNICRLSQALDMSSTDQLVYYIPGVGTEEFKPLALLDGATGFGVPANVRKLYRFLSWNWAPDAAIYMFGFSRGAFTIRMLIDLICKEGLLPTEINGRRVSHQEMVRNSEDAWRAFCSQDQERKSNIWVFLGLPKLRDKFLLVWKKLRGQPTYQEVKSADPARCPSKISIDFAGLFDTVEAYGVPIEEMREGVHRFVFPIKFGGDHTISPNVRCVRHALSLDDERRTFHPIRVSLLPRDTHARIQEVWFAGVHSDVGGGYPEDMAAHVPLLWMVSELRKVSAGNPSRALTFHDNSLEEFKRVASAFGPLHDSRAGAAVLYRYEPREVALKDPRGNAYCSPTVHYTVVERLVNGWDDYAPLALGDGGGADVIMPDGTIAQAQTGPNYAIVQGAGPSNVPATLPAPNQLAMAQRAMRSLDAPDRGEMEVAGDYIWLNRIGYFIFVGLFLVVLALPFLDGAIDDLSDSLSSGVSLLVIPLHWLLAALGPIGDRIARLFEGLDNVIHGAGDTILTLTPSYLHAHVEAALKHPLFTLGLVLAYLGLRHATNTYQDAIRYHARLAWNIQNDRIKTGAGREPGLLSKLVRAIRTSAVARSAAGFSHGVLPAFYAVVFLLVPGLTAANRIGFNYLVGAGHVCFPSGSAEWVANTPKHFPTSDPCWASGWALERGGSYRLTISVAPSDDPWLDRMVLTDPYGFESNGIAHTVGIAWRRWPSAAWFHPIARIGARGDVEWPLVPLDGGGALSPRGLRCSQLPQDYSKTEEHKAYCEEHPYTKSCLGGGSSLGTWDALPKDEIDAARIAWVRDKFLFGNTKSFCNSPFPRKTLVSEFIAQETGELFLFVNDAAHVTWKGRQQAFYANNTGTATVSLERLPLTQARTVNGSQGQTIQ